MRVGKDDWTARIDVLSEFDQAMCRHLDLRQQNGFIASRLALHALLQEQGIVLDKGVSVRTEESGAPFVVLAPEFLCREKEIRFVSISHANQVACVAFGPGALGIDIESIRNDNRSWAEAFLSVDELRWTRGIAERENVNLGTVLTVWWSAKESYLKAIRTGLHTHPRRVVCFLDWVQGTFQVSQSGKTSGTGIFSLEHGGYVTALTVLK